MGHRMSRTINNRWSRVCFSSTTFSRSTTGNRSGPKWLWHLSSKPDTTSVLFRTSAAVLGRPLTKKDPVLLVRRYARAMGSPIF